MSSCGKIVKGGADKSYGIQVAKLAGVPDPGHRAGQGARGGTVATRTITTSGQGYRVSGQRDEENGQVKYDEVDMAQMSLFDTVRDDDVLEESEKSGRQPNLDTHRRPEHAVPALQE
ncbi:MAG: hypothetical protein ACLRT5_07040 [Lachnospiraceae bacterium]